MARVHKVTRSAKEHQCGRGHVIPKGEPYTWAKPGFRTRRPLIRCKAHPFRPSELVSGLASEPMAAQEAFEDALASIDSESTSALEEIQSALEDFRSEVEDYVSQRQEALDAWENGNSTLEELLEVAQAALDELESFEVEEWGGEPDVRDGDLDDEPDEDDDPEGYAEWYDAHQAREDSRSDWTQHAESQLEAASEVSSSLEF